MLARVMERKDKVWLCFASVGNKVIIPNSTAWTVWDEPAGKWGSGLTVKRFLPAKHRWSLRYGEDGHETDIRQVLISC